MINLSAAFGAGSHPFAADLSPDGGSFYRLLPLALAQAQTASPSSVQQARTRNPPTSG